MKKVLILCVLLAVAGYTFACTTMAITKGASVNGSVMVTHTCDTGDGDYRIVYVPAADYEPGSKKAIYPYIEFYPRYVGKDMGPNYDVPGEPTEPLGYIDQVAHTYAFYDGGYGIMNEHQLAIGECTCAAKVYATAVKDECIFDIAALSRVALERCTTAREAIELMGALGVEYGYYGWGETLTVADTEEVWVFEMCPTPDKKSALWVAKKVPDGQIFVEANEFRIRDVMVDDPVMMYSPNLVTVTAEAGWYDPNSDKPLDWLATVSTGEYSMPYYSLRRVWCILDQFAPSLELSPWVEDGFTRAYPFSVTPEKKLAVADIAAAYRNWYQGTEFDLSEGLAAGPFGNINRYSGSSKLVKGSWERAISIFRCSYFLITESRGNLPDPVGGIVWWGPDAPHTTCLVPFYCGMNDLPKSYQIGNMSELDRNAAWWAYNSVGNLADLKFSYAIQDIQAKQQEIESKEYAMEPAIAAAAAELYKTDPELCKAFLTDYSTSNAEKVTAEWWKLADYLMVKYSDGYVNIPTVGKSVGYPDWWLKEVGYENGHVFGPDGYKKPE